MRDILKDEQRRRLLKTGAAIGAGLGAPSLLLPASAWAEGRPPIGTWPAGSSGPTVYAGAAYPLTGTYAAQGADELKGAQLAVEHINNGHPLMKVMSPKTKNGVLGKKLELLYADSGAKPNNAVQIAQRFISENKVVVLTGSTSSAVAVAMNKFAQREKVLYFAGLSGSNDTTGKDCVRYGVRQDFFGQTAAAAIGPVMLKQFGKNRKAAFMTPDYTYGHTVTKSVNDFLTKNGGWTQVTDQVSPLGTQDFSQYLTNIANSGAEFLINVNWGRDAVLSTQQAHKFGLLPKMTLVVPYQTPFLAHEVGAEITQGVLAATDFWWTLEDKYPNSKMFVEAFQKKFNYRPEWSAEQGYVSFAHWARMVEEAGTFYPPEVIKTYEKGETIPSLIGPVHYRPQDHQCVRPVVIVRGKKPSAMKNKEDLWDVLEVVAGGPLMQAPDAFGCKLGDYT